MDGDSVEMGSTKRAIQVSSRAKPFMKESHACRRRSSPKSPEPKGDNHANEKAAVDYQKALAAHKANKKARDEARVRWKKLLAAI